MDVTMMPFVAEAVASAPTPKASGKADSGSNEDGGFAAVFAGLTADGSPGGEGAKETADADVSAGDEQGTSPGVMPGMVPGMWSFVPLMPTAMNAGQAQTATEGTSAIAPLTAAGMQVATRPDAARGQSLPGAQVAPTVTADADLVSQLPLQNQLSQQSPQTSQTQALPTAAGPAATSAPPAQTTGPAVLAKAVPASPFAALTAVAETAAMPQQTAAPATLPQAAAPEVAATAAPTTPAANASPEATTVVQSEAATVSVPTVANSGPRTENAPPADAGAQDQTAAPATAVPTVSATTEPAASGDGDYAATAEKFTADAPQQATTAAPTDSSVFAAMVDQRMTPLATDAANGAATAQQPTNPDPNNVAGQIVDHARLITRADNSEMVIKLKPEHLGELTLKIAVENGTVSATFHTSNVEVRSAIEASLPQLRQDLANQGLKVDNVGVYASLDHFFANDQRHAPQQQQLPTTKRQGGDEVFAAEAVTAAAPQGILTAAGGIDYRV